MSSTPPTMVESTQDVTGVSAPSHCSPSTRHIIPISGKDSLATAIAQTTHAPELAYEYIYNDTKMELPETYEWLDKVEQTLGIKITRSGKNLEAIIYEQEILPSPRYRFCTKYAKIYPMHSYIGKDNAVLYIGIRADEDRAGKEEKRNIRVRYPLQEMGINLPMVYRIVENKGLMPPTFFWKRVYDAVRAELGAQAFVIDEMPRLPVRPGVCVAVAPELFHVLLPAALRVGRTARTPSEAVRPRRAHRNGSGRIGQNPRARLLLDFRGTATAENPRTR